MRAELEQIYLQHRGTLFSLALTVTGCSGLAEDAVHEAFARLCNRTDRPQGSFNAYVFAAVRNAAIDCRRRQKQDNILAESLFHKYESGSLKSSDTASSNLDTSLEDEQLKAALDRLEELSRQIVLLKIFGELTFEEIGEVLTMPAATVATRYRRALIKLEEQLRSNS